MPQIRTLYTVLLVAVLGVGLVAATPATPKPPHDELPPPGTVLLTGDLVEPGEITIKELAALPQRSVDVEFLAGGEPERRSFTGVPLSDVLPPEALSTDDEVRNDLLRFTVLAIASDHYAATVAYGEVSPEFGNVGILLALQQDGVALERPRLVVPGDVRGGRYVTDIVELQVVRVGP